MSSRAEKNTPDCSTRNGPNGSIGAQQSAVKSTPYSHNGPLQHSKCPSSRDLLCQLIQAPSSKYKFLHWRKKGSALQKRVLWPQYNARKQKSTIIRKCGNCSNGFFFERSLHLLTKSYRLTMQLADMLPQSISRAQGFL